MLDTIQKIIDHARNNPSKTIAVAGAHDLNVLIAIKEAASLGLAEATLVGKAEEIEGLLRQLGEEPAAYRILDAQTDEEAAAIAVGEVREGRASTLMKGLMQTGDLMRAVLNKEKGIRGEGLMSHIMLYEPKDFDRCLYITDGGMMTFPDLEQKAGILENAAIALKKLGYGRINAACVCASESVSPKIQSTLDAEALANMTDKGDKYDMKVFGPVGLDLAISQAACEEKGYTAEGGGLADILLVPTYEVGNAMGKALTYFAHAGSAGVIAGAGAPIVLVSRADKPEVKLASIALASALSE